MKWASLPSFEIMPSVTLAVVPQTLTYSSELPLPMPLQCDSIEGGARLGFITIRLGAITMVSVAARCPLIAVCCSQI